MAEIIPFPIWATPSWAYIMQTYQARPTKGRYSKAAYRQKVLDGNVERLTLFGVAPERIEAEIASLERLFARLDARLVQAKKRAAQ